MLLPCSVQALPFCDLRIVLYSDLTSEQIGFMIRLGMSYSKGVQRQYTHDYYLITMVPLMVVR